MKKTNVKSNAEKFREIFREEWQMGTTANRWRIEVAVNADKSGYDPSPSVGEVRLIAEHCHPLAVAVLEDMGDKWLVVPVSEFSVPATDGEILIGPRVFQMWNAFTAAKEIIAAGWRVDTLDADAVEDLLEMRKCVVTGSELPADLAECVGYKIVSVYDLRCKYVSDTAVNEREFQRIVPLSSVLPQKSECDDLPDDDLLDIEGEELILPDCAGVDDSAVEAEIIAPPEERVAMCKLSNVAYSHAACCRVGGARFSYFNVAPAHERYAEFHENGFRDPKSDPLSTFGLDVDTASYTVMRRCLNEEKTRPPVDSVRLEEFINYFDYGYAGPADGAPVAVNCELGACPWNKGHQLLRVGVQARRVDESKIPPCNLVFLLDCSGSMSGEFDTVISSMKMLVSKLRPEDYVSIVTYASGTEVKLKATSGAERGKIESVLDSLDADGFTAGEDGIQLAYEEAKKNFRKGANNRVVLITDGDFNVGIDNPQELERFISEKRDTGIFLTVMGVGMGNYQDAMMKKLSTAGNGNYGYIDNLTEAKRVFMREFGGTMTTVAKDVKLQIEFNPSRVSEYRLLGYECRDLAARDFNDDRKAGGEMGAGHSMTALYEIVPAGTGGGDASVDALKYQKTLVLPSEELLTVKLRYKEPDGDTSRKLEFPVKGEVAAQASESFRFASAVAEAAMLLRDSEHKGDASWESLIERAKGAKGKDADGRRAEFIRLMETAELIRDE